MNWTVVAYSVGMATALSLGIVAMKKGTTMLGELGMAILSFSIFFIMSYMYIQLVIK